MSPRDWVHPAALAAFRVMWDGLLPRMLAHHDPAELEPTGVG